jgi:serine/threonine-protein kinase
MDPNHRKPLERIFDEAIQEKVGDQIGNYTIEELLGRGGNGTVYLAYDTKLHRRVALKMMTASAQADTSHAMLLREARNAAALNHPNICTIYEVSESNAVAFIAMEYVEGSSLRHRIDAGALPIHETVRYGVCAAEALAYAHEHGVVHRDFKAANVIVTNEGRLKIVDFGLARRWDAVMRDMTTMVSVAPEGSIVGTPYAMAPEQVRGEAIDERTDIWSLGVLLYEMATGTQPFKASTTPELLAAVLRDVPAPLPRNVRSELKLVIERCLEKSPDRRYQKANDVRSALEVLQPAVLQRSAARRSPFLAVAVIAAIAVLLIVLNLFGVRDWLAERMPLSETRLAILPLENMTGDTAQDYLSDGLTDQLITAFSRLHSTRLNVIARTDSVRYKHSAKPLDQIGRELTANTVLTGTITRSADHVRVFAELVEPSNRRQLWSDTYDRSANDLTIIENEIFRAVSGAIRIPLAETEKKRLLENQKVNPEAYDLYLRALSHVVRSDEKDIDQAITLLEKSTALDPAFVPAYGYLALAYGLKSGQYRPNDAQWEEKGFAAVQRALKLDPDAPEAHYAQGFMLWRPSHGFPNREALAEFRKALTARPNFDEAWHQHAVVLFHVGHLEPAAREIEKALEINPSNTVARFRFGPIYVYQQRFEDALAALNRVPRESFPAQWHYQRAWSLISLGRLDEAGHFLEESLKDNPVDQGGVLHAARAMLRAKRGDRQGAETDIAEAIRVGRNFIHFHHTAYSIGAIYATMGDFDKAQEWIENAANDGFPNYTFFETDIHLARLRSVPRFQAFLSKLRQEWERIPGEPN